MITHTESIEIKAPVSDVFAFISNVENIPRWQSEVVTSKVVSPSPLRSGTRFEEVVRILGRRVSTVCEVTDYQPTKRFGFRSISGTSIAYDGQMQFEPNGRGTHLTLSATFRLKGFWKLAEPLFRFDVRKAISEELKALKSLLENSPS
jgi:uncharacterized membrane protein